MEPAALGGYAALFCQLWEQPDPGVVPDDDRLLSSLSRMDRTEWDRVRPQIARAFDTTSRPGFWLQKGLVETARAQDRFKRAQSERGKQGANARWPNTGDGASIANEPPCKRDGPSVLGSRFSGSGSTSESEKIAAPAADRSPPTNGNPATLDPLIGSLASALSMRPNRARAPLMAKVKSQVEALPPDEKAKWFKFAGWLAKDIRDDECVLRVVADAMERNGTVGNLFSYYAVNGPARTTIEGHYRADQQDHESKRWKAEEWDWVRAFKARQEANS